MIEEISLPDLEVVKEATKRAFSGKVEDNDLQRLLVSLDASYPSYNAEPYASEAVLTDAPEAAAFVVPEAAALVPSGAKIASASIYFGLVFGIITCEVDGKKFEVHAWGIGASALTSKGIIYTTYDSDSWDAFFEETRFYHAQGVAEAGGIFQITFMDADHIPTGQFNGVAGGIALFEVGGGGRWK
jgi:hypothetical protein